MRSARQGHVIAYTGLCAQLLYSLAYFAIGVFDAVDSVRHASEYVREPFHPGDANWSADQLRVQVQSPGETAEGSID